MTAALLNTTIAQQASSKRGLVWTATVDAGESVAATMRPTSGTVTWDWGDGSSTVDDGTGTTNDGTDVQHTYAAAGTYTIRITASEGMQAVDRVDIRNQPFTGNMAVPEWVNLASLRLQSCPGLTGNMAVPEWVNLATLYLSGCPGLTGDMAVPEWVNLATLYLISCPGLTAGSTWAIAAAIRYLRIDDCSLSPAEVDRVVQSVYDARASITNASPYLHVGGASNASPSGTYQSACPPTSALEQVHQLATDGCAEGINTWTVVHN